MRDSSYNFSKQNSQKPNQIRGGEKKVMKKSLSLLLALTLAFSMFATAAFAATTELDVNAKFQALKDKGILSGVNANGDAALDKDMTRAEFAKVLTVLLGLQQDKAAAASYKDKGIASHWAAGYIGAVTNAKIMNGANGFFTPSAKITIEQVAKTLVVALGLKPVEGAKVEGTSAWAAGYVQAAIDAKLITAVDNYKANATRELLVNVTYSVVESAEALAIVEAKQVGVKKIQVVFNKPVAETTAIELKQRSCTLRSNCKSSRH